MDIFSIVLFAVVVAIYFLRGAVGKNISMTLGIIYASMMCCTSMLDHKWIATLVYLLLGLLCVFLLYCIKESQSKKRNKKSKTFTVLLSFFLGAFGIHRFYLGQKTLGAIYLLLWWTTIPLYVSMAEAIYFLILPKEKFNNKYNSETLDIQTESQKKQWVKSNVRESQNPDNSTVNIETPAFDEEMPRKVYYSNIALPIGLCSAVGEEGNFEISIITGNNQYKFGVNGDQIATYWKLGMSDAERYEC